MPLVCGATAGYSGFFFFFFVFPQKPGTPQFWGRLPVLGREGGCIQGENPPSGKGWPLCLGGPVGRLSFHGSTGAKPASSSPGSSGKQRGRRETLPSPQCQWQGWLAGATALVLNRNQGFWTAPWVLLPHGCLRFNPAGFWWSRGGIPLHRAVLGVLS